MTGIVATGAEPSDFASRELVQWVCWEILYRLWRIGCNDFVYIALLLPQSHGLLATLLKLHTTSNERMIMSDESEETRKEAFGMF
jgi:hypothetical protein